MKTITIEYKTKADRIKYKNILAVNLISYSKFLMAKGCYGINII